MVKVLTVIFKKKEENGSIRAQHPGYKEDFNPFNYSVLSPGKEELVFDRL